MIPPDYLGVMICDRGSSYDAEVRSGIRQRKCLRPIRSIEAEITSDASNRFAFDLKASLETAHDQRRKLRTGDLERANYDEKGAKIDREITSLLIKERSRLHFLREARDDSTPKRLRDRTDRKLLAEIGEHHERGNALQFLHDPSIEPTSNRAERALQPAVIARKVSHCS